MADSLRKKLLFVLPVAAAVAIFVLMVRGKEPPVKRGPDERATAVRTIRTPVVDLVPRAIGYGYVKPELVWEAVAEVQGKIVDIHPDLKRGALLARGQLLARIDPAQRITATEQNRAEVSRMLAGLEELQQRRVNLGRTLAVQRRSLELSERELERRRKLVEEGTISFSELDQEEKNYLTQQNTVQELENQLALIPAEERELKAQLVQARSRLEDARLDLEKTELRAPFDCRVREASIELGQAVNSGEVLARLDSIGVAETLAEFPLHVMRRIVPRGASPLAGGVSMDNLRKFLDFGALVRVSMDGRTVEWDGRVVRIREEVDPNTRTIGVYVAVEDPYLQAVPGQRPPLVRNMYCEVELRGRPRPDSVVVPRNAVRQGMALVADAENRLRRVPVELDMVQDDLAVIASGLSGGERVVVSDVPYAVDGMLLAPQADEALERGVILRAEAREAQGGERGR